MHKAYYTLHLRYNLRVSKNTCKKNRDRLNEKTMVIRKMLNVHWCVAAVRSEPSPRPKKEGGHSPLPCRPVFRGFFFLFFISDGRLPRVICGLDLFKGGPTVLHSETRNEPDTLKLLLWLTMDFFVPTTKHLVFL